MANSIRNFCVRSLLRDKAGYVIPMYQRNFAWGKGEIGQLIQDVKDYQSRYAEGSGSQHYYIGTLVVHRSSDGRFDVIDGQQRFTTLLLICLCLKNLGRKAEVGMSWLDKVNLEFESRPKSSETFIELFCNRPVNELESDEFNDGVVYGYKVILEELQRWNKQELSAFSEYLLNNVLIMRVMVPGKTDLNHYFEIMNNRGEQLEKHEVLKADMLGVLNTIRPREHREACTQALHQVWDACANMERYVQYGFGVEQRHRLFGRDDWARFRPKNFDDLLNKLGQGSVDKYDSEGDSLSLREIIDSPPMTESGSKTGDDAPDRFNSVINFPNFLLHVLRVMTEKDIPLDDKQLLTVFNEHVLGKYNRAGLVQEFVYVLLKCKFMFDQYVIKRDFTEGDSDGKWSLKRLKWYSTKSVSYKNSFDDKEGGYDGVNRQILMLLSAFHVSIPSMVYKHWLSAALYYLYNQKAPNSESYLEYLEDTARTFVSANYLAGEDSCSYYDMIFWDQDEAESVDTGVARDRLRYGNIRSNFVFNYLDYLLWKKHRNKGKIYREFEFTFRSSVEHFYPQNPKGVYDHLPDGVLHDFGNLCLISHTKNSRMGNDSPKGKLDYFRESLKNNQIDSLKLKHMIEVADGDNWREPHIEKHAKEMFDVLLSAL